MHSSELKRGLVPGTVLTPGYGARYAVKRMVDGRGYYSVTEAAALLGVNRVSVWRWIRAGHLPAARLGHRTTRIRREDIEQVLVRVGGRSKRAAWREDTAGAHHGAEHVVQFYESDDFLLDAIAGFLGEALREHGVGLALATPEHVAGLERRLVAAGLNVGKLRSSERLITLDASETLARICTDGEVDEAKVDRVIGGLVARAAEVAGDRKVHAFGELVALLVDAGNSAGAIRLERLWNGLQTRHRFALFCGYPMDQFGGTAFSEVLSDVCAEHSRVVPAESYSALEDPHAQLRAIAILQQQAQSLAGVLVAERAAREKAEAAVRAREEFLSIAAHELKTPITTIMGRAQLDLRRLGRGGTVAPEDLTDTLETIVQQARRMTVLTTHLLDVTRLERGELPLHERETDLVALARGVADAMPLDRARHSVTLRAPEKLIVWVDPMRMEQVVTNLLDNATRYSPQGGAIDVTLEAVNGGSAGSGETWARVTVRDHGVGVPEVERERVFDRFHRAHAVAGNAGWALGGLGLGLYITRQVVEQHGGTIVCERPADGDSGTAFVVTLPCGQRVK